MTPTTLFLATAADAGAALTPPTTILPHNGGATPPTGTHEANSAGGCIHPTTDVERVVYAYAPLKALVNSRGVTLHAAVAKARGMRASMLARRNTKGVRTSNVRGAGTAPDTTPTHVTTNDD